jgi:hypothetical protein
VLAGAQDAKAAALHACARDTGRVAACKRAKYQNEVAACRIKAQDRLTQEGVQRPSDKEISSEQKVIVSNGLEGASLGIEGRK